MNGSYLSSSSHVHKHRECFWCQHPLCGAETGGLTGHQTHTHIHAHTRTSPHTHTQTHTEVYWMTATASILQNCLLLLLLQCSVYGCFCYFINAVSLHRLTLLRLQITLLNCKHKCATQETSPNKTETTSPTLTLFIFSTDISFPFQSLHQNYVIFIKSTVDDNKHYFVSSNTAPTWREARKLRLQHKKIQFPSFHWNLTQQQQFHSTINGAHPCLSCVDDLEMTSLFVKCNTERIFIYMSHFVLNEC